MTKNRYKKPQSAVALGYKRQKDQAPRLLAKGRGELARNIIEAARAHGVPVREDPLLVEALIGLDMYQEVPQELYQVIAEIFAFLYRMKNQAGFSTAEKIAGLENYEDP